MRVGVVGTHRVGKTSLIEAVAARLPRYRVFDEPYPELEERGYEFSDPPSAEDFEAQLRHAIATLRSEARDALFDRTPLDFVGYLRAIDAELDLDELRPALARAMGTLELVVLVAIESPDRIAVSASEDRRLRRRADLAIGSLVLDDPLELGVPVLEVRGDLDSRVRQVMRALAAR